jgi:NhaP-type Na+/H+ or K+/H+ antiporter
MLAARLVLSWSWAQAALFGSLVVVTGPTVVTPLLREMRLRNRPKTVLEAEGVLIDPVGVILAVLVLEIVLVPRANTIASELRDVLVRFGFGLGAGVLSGGVLAWLLRLRTVVPQSQENILSLAWVVFVFFGCDNLVPHSGIVAVTVCGIAVGNFSARRLRDLREFKDQLTVLLVGLLFMLLAAGVRRESVLRLGWSGAMVVACLVLVVRPVSVWLSTLGSTLKWRERVFIGWVAPRGIVAAALASLTSVALDNEGVAGGEELRALVFMTIAGTVVLAGATARPLGSLLRLRLPRRERVAIVGAQGLGLLVGQELRDGDVPVIFLDSDPKRCREVEELGFAVVFGNALEERTLLRARPELFRIALGATFNDHLNSLFVGQVRRDYGVPEGLVSIDSLERGSTPDHVARQGAQVLFEGPHDQERWDVRVRHGDVRVVRYRYEPQDTGEDDETLTPLPPSTGDSTLRSEQVVMLVVRRDRSIEPIRFGYTPRAGDVVSMAIHEPDEENVNAWLRSRGWTKIPEEKGSQDIDPAPRNDGS